MKGEEVYLQRFYHHLLSQITIYYNSTTAIKITLRDRKNSPEIRQMNVPI